MNWKFAKHKDLSMAEGLRIAYLKDQHWPYGLESQILWMRDNIESDDIHLMGEEESESKTELVAYITLSNVTVLIDGFSMNCLGVGGVCVDKRFQHQGVGKQLVSEASNYIHGIGRQGILLCKDKLVPFYRANDWDVLNYKHALVAGNTYEHVIMLLNRECSCSNITIDKNF